ncbi:hypothetical protein CDL15_Pgr010629 [Punica granatum]|uniref:Uncharacterized protein n=1 Tax=Punica granatum TaxID=22663 RepID=A0A218VSG3_PUNGR|nr:hypothetical protein CDL15_Pgr010629 [Punica granatum]
MKKWRTLCFFWAIMALHAVAILIFTRGFLLTRTELPFHSNCSDVSKESPCFSNSPQGSDVNSTEGRCWTKPAIGRLVIIVLDAIRFDFVAPSSFFKEKKPWMDRLPVLQKLAFGEGSSARIFKAIADPPTTSLQRLKGLTTGGLPTFIDVGNSFGAPAIVEDNLIHQVDNGCIDNLLPTLYEEDWDVLIAHFLGVDHAGHIFGVDSAPMIEKLEQYNGVLEKVIDALESQSRPGGLHENTYLLVMGDHGQTLNGDHGGGSPEEVALNVETSTFAMSFRRPPSPIVPELDIPCEFDLERRSCISNFQQLDFAATVSALMGIPFPFGSIGHVNPEMYALAVNTGNSEDNSMGLDQYELASKEWLLNYANVLCVNTWQVKRYIDIYSASSMIGFSSEDISRIADMYTKAEKTYRQIKDNASHRIEEGKVANFLLATSGLVMLRYSIMRRKMLLEVGYCIVRFHDLEGNASGTPLVLAVNPLSLTQWCLFAVCLFFCTGHWCAFDGLRYGAAFIGFDEFVLVRQAILLTIDTFGFSHIIPIFGLPFLLLTAGDEKKGFPFARLSLVYMIYGFITAATVTATLLCVMVHRRHLMVWGLFAPKFVFDVVGLMLTDVLICVASLYFLGRTRDNTPAHDHAIGN